MHAHSPILVDRGLADVIVGAGLVLLGGLVLLIPVFALATFRLGKIATPGRVGDPWIYRKEFPGLYWIAFICSLIVPPPFAIYCLYSGFKAFLQQ
jgi:hypothetical protein